MSKKQEQEAKVLYLFPPNLEDAAKRVIRAQKACDEAVRRCEQAAEVVTKDALLTCILDVCKNCDTFSTDHVWDFLAARGTAPPREPRVLGAMMRKAVSYGWCEPTHVHLPSVRPECHRRPVRQYKSKLKN